MDLAKIEACIDELCMHSGLPGESWQADESDMRHAIGCLVRMVRRRRGQPSVLFPTLPTSMSADQQGIMPICGCKVGTVCNSTACPHRMEVTCKAETSA